MKAPTFIDEVAPPVGDTNAPTFSEAHIEDARKRLRAVLPVGTVPSMELVRAKAEQLGISEALLQAIQGGNAPTSAPVKNLKDMTASELKADMQRQRNEARGGNPLSRQTTHRGY